MADFHFGELGDEQYFRLTNGDSIFLYEHQIGALVENSVEDVFGDGNVVHHQSGAKCDNRPENFETLTYSEHSQLHNNGVWETNEDGFPELQMPEYGDVTKYATAGD
ncbi:hypothetical protein [Halococcus sp. IIIV-5B]|uniref:hypothetical protein n=1 Tax=Halococcus sp. IIIV-5B TaxID=2321230 RepID=UPI000E766761|nr:hypothetical protein [Halococcus sp. IIIV-5B]RJT03855.1 hypothetical protein D3261_10445 [Halococcus sp. IIIV-5B]